MINTNGRGPQKKKQDLGCAQRGEKTEKSGRKKTSSKKPSMPKLGRNGGEDLNEKKAWCQLSPVEGGRNKKK